jgi:hypothetical protein
MEQSIVVGTKVELKIPFQKSARANLWLCFSCGFRVKINLLKLLFFSVAVLTLLTLPEASRRFAEVTFKSAREA